MYVCMYTLSATSEVKILNYFLTRSLVVLQLPCYTIVDFCFAMVCG